MNKETLFKERIQPWKQLEQKGVGVHVGEWGAFNRTPHKVVLAWMQDYLALWKDAGWGWSLWNLQGAFGVLDSQRADVEYESFRGHNLDREMLTLLQQG
jgi:endoglucanase